MKKNDEIEKMTFTTKIEDITEDSLQFRDLQLAQDFMKKADMGYLETEFVAYGLAFYKDNKRQYIVSTDETEIYSFQNQLVLEGCCPTSMAKRKTVFRVPDGCEETATEEIKFEVAKYLQEQYSEKYFTNLSNLMNGEANNQAEKLLAPFWTYLNGKYNADWLQLFSSTVDIVFLRKNITKVTYEKIKMWINRCYKEMSDTPLVKDMFERTFYGMAIKEKTGKWNHYFNANCATLKKKYENALSDGQLTTPIFAKKYWYSYTYTLDNVKNDFKNYLYKIMNHDYLTLIEYIDALPTVVQVEDIEALKKSLQIKKGTPQCKSVDLNAGFLGVRKNEYCN